MVDVRGDVLRPPHGTTPAAVKSSRSRRRISGDNEFYSIYPNGKGYVIFGLSAIRLRDAVRPRPV